MYIRQYDCLVAVFWEHFLVINIDLSNRTKILTRYGYLQIEQTFTAGFRMICNIDQIAPATNESLGTEVRAHFIRDNAPVLAYEIERWEFIYTRNVLKTLLRLRN